jgi:hypothetical protein
MLTIVYINDRYIFWAKNAIPVGYFKPEILLSL